MVNIVADAYIPFLKGALESQASVKYMPGDRITRNDLKKTDILIIRTRTHAGPELLDGTPVKMIATATIGTDHLDITYLEEEGIRWVHAPGCNAGSVMQYIASVLVWESQVKGFHFRDKTIGVIGVGNVGSRIVKLAGILGCSVLQNDPPRERRERSGDFVDLDTVLSRSDIVTLHVPLTLEGRDKTSHMVNSDFLSKIKPGALLVNTSRGGVVDEQALLFSLMNKRLSGAVLDVWENEPGINPHMLKKVDLGTPHIAGYSVDGKANGTRAVVRAVKTFLGEDPSAWQIGRLPVPENKVITLDTACQTDQELLQQAVQWTYAVEEDDKSLRADPGGFEKLRVHYPVRREFFAYEVRVDKSRGALIDKLEKLGFNIKTV